MGVLAYLVDVGGAPALPGLVRRAQHGALRNPAARFGLRPRRRGFDSGSSV